MGIDFADPLVRRVFFDVYERLPRGGPGDRASVGRALALVGELPAAPRVLDLGCGPGAQTLHLAELLPAARIVAVDNHAPFVARAGERIVAAGLAGRVAAQVGDMAALPFADGTFDLLWSEGAAYMIGVQHALQTWRRLVPPGGPVAFSDAIWTRPGAPAELQALWAEEYAELTDAPGTIGRITAAGWRLCGWFELPQTAWWDEFYTPMERVLAERRAAWAAEPRALATLTTLAEEIEMMRRWGDWYNYGLFVARRDD
jgi:SAM-dependent methyltransferase